MQWFISAGNTKKRLFSLLKINFQNLKIPNTLAEDKQTTDTNSSNIIQPLSSTTNIKLSNHFSLKSNFQSFRNEMGDSQKYSNYSTSLKPPRPSALKDNANFSKSTSLFNNTNIQSSPKKTLQLNLPTKGRNINVENSLGCKKVADSSNLENIRANDHFQKRNNTANLNEMMNKSKQEVEISNVKDIPKIMITDDLIAIEPIENDVYDETDKKRRKRSHKGSNKDKDRYKRELLQGKFILTF